MKPRITLITLGVDDLARAVRFYRDGLGPTTEGIVGTELEHGAVAATRRRARLRAAWYAAGAHARTGATTGHHGGVTMRRPGWLLTAALLLILASGAGADTLRSPAEARQLTDRVMARVAAGDLEGGLRVAKPYVMIPEAEFEAMMGQTRLQMPVMLQRFGKSIGRELVREDKVGESVVRVMQLHKFERHATRWTFIFYRGEGGGSSTRSASMTTSTSCSRSRTRG